MELYIEWGFYFLLLYSGLLSGYIFRFLTEPKNLVEGGIDGERV